MANQHPHIIIITGPNGAGKSTAALSLLQGMLGVKDFVNAVENPALTKSCRVCKNTLNRR